MNVQETLAQIDHIMTEVDLELYQWQTDLDFMSFIGVNATVELWTNDDPPRVVTKDVLSQAAGKELRVMHFIEGEGRVQVGIATVNENGILVASIDRDIPELRTSMNFSLGSDMTIKPAPVLPKNPPFEGLNKPLTIRGLHETIAENEEHLSERAAMRREWLNKTHTKVHDAARRIDLGLYKTHSKDVVDKLREIDLENHPFFDNKEND